MTNSFLELQTQLGGLRVRVEDCDIVEIEFVDELANESTNLSKLEMQIVKELKEYFSGERKEFDLKIKLGGTMFQQKVWNEIAKIPFGEMISYTELAKRVGKPRAVRAVGSACGANLIPVIIPCHRVRGKTGLGGYSGGLWRKEKLLRLEGVTV